MTDEPPNNCAYCDAPGDVDEGWVLHTGDCPFVTNIFPIDRTVLGTAMCPVCDVDFADEEFYTTIQLDPCHPAALEVAKAARELFEDDNVGVVFAVCLGCAVTGREIPRE
jgi:hypothetical protein